MQDHSDVSRILLGLPPPARTTPLATKQFQFVTQLGSPEFISDVNTELSKTQGINGVTGNDTSATVTYDDAVIRAFTGRRGRDVLPDLVHLFPGHDPEELLTEVGSYYDEPGLPAVGPVPGAVELIAQFVLHVARRAAMQRRPAPAGASLTDARCVQTGEAPDLPRKRLL